MGFKYPITNIYISLYLLDSMVKNITMDKLEKYAIDNEEVHFINTKKGKLVVFNPDRFVWNAYGKDSIDTENYLTDDQWIDFKSSYNYMYLEMEYNFYSELEEYCKDNDIEIKECD